MALYRRNRRTPIFYIMTFYIIILCASIMKIIETTKHHIIMHILLCKNIITKVIAQYDIGIVCLQDKNGNEYVKPEVLQQLYESAIAAPWEKMTIERPQFPIDDTFDTFGMGFRIGTYRGESKPLFVVICAHNGLTCSLHVRTYGSSSDCVTSRTYLWIPF